MRRKISAAAGFQESVTGSAPDFFRFSSSPQDGALFFEVSAFEQVGIARAVIHVG